MEADDSTRQIIAALLRKCGYKGESLVFVLWSLWVSVFFFFVFFVLWCSEL